MCTWLLTMWTYKHTHSPVFGDCGCAVKTTSNNNNNIPHLQWGPSYYIQPPHPSLSSPKDKAWLHVSLSLSAANTGKYAYLLKKNCWSSPPDWANAKKKTAKEERVGGRPMDGTLRCCFCCCCCWTWDAKTRAPIHCKFREHLTWLSV